MLSFLEKERNVLAVRPRSVSHVQSWSGVMNIDEESVDEAVLALLQLTRHDECHAWKGHDFEVLNRLYEKGFICDPVNKRKSVTFTDAGLKKSKNLFEAMFVK